MAKEGNLRERREATAATPVLRERRYELWR